MYEVPDFGPIIDDPEVDGYVGHLAEVIPPFMYGPTYTAGRFCYRPRVHLDGGLVEWSRQLHMGLDQIIFDSWECSYYYVSSLVRNVAVQGLPITDHPSILNAPSGICIQDYLEGYDSKIVVTCVPPALMSFGGGIPYAGSKTAKMAGYRKGSGDRYDGTQPINLPPEATLTVREPASDETDVEPLVGNKDSIEDLATSLSRIQAGLITSKKLGVRTTSERIDGYIVNGVLYNRVKDRNGKVTGYNKYVIQDRYQGSHYVSSPGGGLSKEQGLTYAGFVESLPPVTQDDVKSKDETSPDTTRRASGNSGWTESSGWSITQT